MRTAANAGGRILRVVDDPDDLLTVDQAAARLRCGRTKLFALIGQGDLPSTKVGRARQIRRGDVDAYLDRERAAR